MSEASMKKEQNNNHYNDNELLATRGITTNGIVLECFLKVQT